MSSKQYVKVSEFIQSSGDLTSDGEFYYHPDLFAYAYPTGKNLQLKLVGDYTAFGTGNPTYVDNIVPQPTLELTKIGIIGKTLVTLNTNNVINFYRFASDGLTNDDAYINSEFAEVLAADGIIDFDIQKDPINGIGTGAVFLSVDGTPIFYNVPYPANISDFTSGKFANDVAVNNEKHFCLRFTDGSLLYYNGATFDDSSYELVPTDIVTSANYEIAGFESSPKESPNEIVDVQAVTAYSGFNVLTNDGRVIVWGGNLQPINDNDPDYTIPSITNNINQLYDGGIEYGCVKTALGSMMAWGKTSDLIDDANSVTDTVRDVLCSDYAIYYTTDRGRVVEGVGSVSAGVTDRLTENILFDDTLDNFKDDNPYWKSLAISTDENFNFIYNEHLNESFDPVRIDFKMIQHEGDYYIPLSDFFLFDVAGIRMEVFHKLQQTTGNLGKNIRFSVDDIFTSSGGNPDKSKVVVSPIDLDNNGVPDDPFAYKSIVGDGDYIVLETFIDTDNTESTRIARNVKFISEVAFLAPNEVYYADINRTIFDVYGEAHEYTMGGFYRGVENVNNVVVNYAEELPMGYDEVNGKRFMLKNGKGYSDTEPFMFQWNHYSTDGGDIIDPSISNLMDMYILTTNYDIEVRRWLKTDGNPDTMPTPPTSEELRTMIKFIETNKSTSDQIIYIPAKYKLLFGESARAEHRATFNVVKTSGATMSDNEIKSRIVNATNDYFDIDNWDFGDRFYFSELATYIHNQLIGEIASIVIVPKFRDSSFGDLYQIQSEPNELFLSTASVDDVVINPQYTSQNMRRG